MLPTGSVGIGMARNLVESGGECQRRSSSAEDHPVSDALAEDAGVPPVGSGFLGIACYCVVRPEEDVDAVPAEAAQRTDGKVSRPAQRAPWVAASGYFTDPDGNLRIVAAATDGTSNRKEPVRPGTGRSRPK